MLVCWFVDVFRRRRVCVGGEREGGGVRGRGKRREEKINFDYCFTFFFSPCDPPLTFLVVLVFVVFFCF